MSGNRFMNSGSENRPTRYYSKRQEKRGSKVIGLRTTANSGATNFQKGDARDDDLLIEFKTLVKPQKSHSLKKEWFTKNEEEAFATGRIYSGVAFDFGDGEDYVAVPIDTFAEFYQAWKKQNGKED